MGMDSDQLLFTFGVLVGHQTCTRSAGSAPCRGGARKRRRLSLRAVGRSTCPSAAAAPGTQRDSTPGPRGRHQMPRTEDTRARAEARVALCGSCGKALQKPLACVRCKAATFVPRDCQIKAWKAGHKGECPADQERVLQELNQLAAAADWRRVAAQERAFMRTSMPETAQFVGMNRALAAGCYQISAARFGHDFSWSPFSILGRAP
jgi:hypothetical protein